MSIGKVGENGCSRYRDEDWLVWQSGVGLTTQLGWYRGTEFRPL